MVWSAPKDQMGDARVGLELNEVQQFPADRWSRYCCLFLVVLGLFWCLARFWGLESAPYGIWMDESRVALHTACVAETGSPASGDDWPLFAPAFGGGHHPSILIYFEMAWTELFGNAIASFRAALALFNLVTIAGLTLIARRVGGSLLALLVFLSSALSPWSFQFSRIVWEGPIGPACMVFAVYCLLQAPRWYWAISAGVLGALAMFNYPPLRLATPLVLASVGLYQLRRSTLRWRVRDMALAVAALVVTLAPVLWMTFQGRLSQRAMDVAIFSPRYIHDHRGSMSPVSFVLSQFLDNLFSHFRPSFLFFSGDINLRHSPHIVGQLSPVDAVALVAVGVWLGLVIFNTLRSSRTVSVEVSRYRRRLLLCAAAGTLGFVFGSIPAALTWDGEPHALRSIAAWPWACFAGGASFAFWVSKRPQLVLPLLVLGCFLYTLHYMPKYFESGKTLPNDYFRRDLREAVDNRGNKPILDVVGPWIDTYGGEEELRYYLIRWGHFNCQTSDTALHELNQTLQASPNRRRKRQRH
ncbi:MAG TPA: hypothetical protein VFN67_36190 [Polyangiales bacterium]|nr:hypothetical protein [Polyangiales bacterium]